MDNSKMQQIKSIKVYHYRLYQKLLHVNWFKNSSNWLKLIQRWKIW